MELADHLFTLKILILQGLPRTLLLSVAALALAFLLGLLFGLLRSYKIPVVHQVLEIYLGMIRGIPFLLLLLLVYFCVPVKNKFGASLVTLTVYNATYICEIIHGGVLGLGKGQFKAAASLGMNTPQTLWYVIVPQVLNLTMPALLGQLVILIKGTAACSAIGYYEITRVGYNAMQEFANPHIIFLYILVLYFILCHALTTYGKRWEKRGKLKMMGKY